MRWSWWNVDAMVLMVLMKGWSADAMLKCSCDGLDKMLKCWCDGPDEMLKCWCDVLTKSWSIDAMVLMKSWSDGLDEMLNRWCDGFDGILKCCVSFLMTLWLPVAAFLVALWSLAAVILMTLWFITAYSWWYCGLSRHIFDIVVPCGGIHGDIVALLYLGWVLKWPPSTHNRCWIHGF